MRTAILSIGILLFISCAGGKPGGLQTESKPPVRIPERIVFEKGISGRILAYDLQHPAGVAVDAQGSIYVSDGDNHRLIKFDAQYNPIRDYGGYGDGIGKFLNPEDILIDRGLNLYVLDTGNRRIVHLDTRLNFIEEIFPEDDPAEIISNRGKLSGLQISPLGEITVADYDNSRLIRLDNFNRFSRYIGGFGYGKGALLNPQDISISGDGRSYVADAGNSRIAIYDDYGNYLGDIGGGQLSNPTALTVSPYGNIWVADRELQEIFVFAPDGRLLLEAEGNEKDGYGFSDIKALAVSPDSKLYLADSGRNRIMVFSIVYEGSR